MATRFGHLNWEQQPTRVDLAGNSGRGQSNSKNGTRTEKAVRRFIEAERRRRPRATVNGRAEEVSPRACHLLTIESPAGLMMGEHRQQWRRGPNG